MLFDNPKTTQERSEIHNILGRTCISNWKTDYRVKYHITFTHIDQKTGVKNDFLFIEAVSPDEVERIIIDQFKNNNDILTEVPEGWVGIICNEELKIDEVIKLWKYQQ